MALVHYTGNGLVINQCYTRTICGLDLSHVYIVEPLSHCHFTSQNRMDSPYRVRLIMINFNTNAM